MDMIPVGRLIRPFGIKGELLFEPFNMERNPVVSDVILSTPKGEQTVTYTRPHSKNRLIIKLNGVGDIDTAERFRGLLVQIPENALPELPQGIFYHYQLIGLKVETQDGIGLGTLERIIDTGPNNVYVVRHPDSKLEVLVAAIPQAIEKVDLEYNLMIVNSDYCV